MRIPKDRLGDRQRTLLDGENYVDRVFVTNVPGRPHIVIEDYDQRAAGLMDFLGYLDRQRKTA